MNLINIGKIVNTHGIKGEVRILSNFPYKDKVFALGNVIYIDKVNREVISSYRRHKVFDMITMEGYNNINDVLKYKGKCVYIDKDSINLELNEYLDEDIEGLNVIYKEENRGVVNRIERYTKNVLLVIKRENKEYLIPYNFNIIDKIDVNNKKIYIKDINGLFD